MIRAFGVVVGGKSAIMTGIVVGLGGCAAHTNRAQSLKGLIKKGCPYV